MPAAPTGTGHLLPPGTKSKEMSCDRRTGDSLVMALAESAVLDAILLPRRVPERVQSPPGQRSERSVDPIAICTQVEHTTPKLPREFPKAALMQSIVASLGAGMVNYGEFDCKQELQPRSPKPTSPFMSIKEREWLLPRFGTLALLERLSSRTSKLAVLKPNLAASLESVLCRCRSQTVVSLPGPRQRTSKSIEG